MKYLCIWLVRFYQKYLSPLKRTPTCRFFPTCSAYAIEAFQKRGFWAGLILTVYRILRCQPLCPGGFDPVPDTGFKHHTVPGEEKGFLKYKRHYTGNELTHDSATDESDTQNAPVAIQQKEKD